MSWIIVLELLVHAQSMKYSRRVEPTLQRSMMSMADFVESRLILQESGGGKYIHCSYLYNQVYDTVKPLNL